MTAVNHGNKAGTIVGREAKSAPKAYLYRLRLEDGTETTVLERSNVPEKHIGDQWIVTVYDDRNFNVFVKHL